MFCYNDILKAHKRIQSYVRNTPLDKSIYLSDAQTNFYMKLESHQVVKSFKIRGAFSKITTLTEAEKNRGVVAISSGNHGIAVSYAAKTLGIDKVHIIVPENTPQSKIEKIKLYGGHCIIKGKSYDEAHHYGKKFIANNNMTEIDAYYDDPEIYAGQGTIGLELLAQAPHLDTIMVPIGGGGIITGIAVAAKSINPAIKIIGVQPKACPAMLQSMKENHFYEDFPSEPSICEALIGGVGKLSFDLSNQCIDEIVLVTEAYVRKGVTHMIKSEKQIVEPSSAICVGAILENPNRHWGSNVAMVMTGGNIDHQLMCEILAND